MTARRLAAVLGFLAVALGAFGAHGLEATFAEVGDKALDWWRTATLYHLLHAAALLAIGSADATRRPGAAGWAFTAGIALFSGSLYAMAVGAPRWLGMVTPVGGLCLLAGWALVYRDR